MQDTLLEVRGVIKQFGGLSAVRWVDLQVPRGAIMSVIGPNGAGKSTLFKVITGSLPLDGGEIYFKGRLINGFPSDRITRFGIAHTYQRIRLFTGMSALENVLVGMHTRLKSNPLGALLKLPATQREDDAARAKAHVLLTLLGVGDIGDQLAERLPYATQRRVEIARALASDPELLLLDEPTVGMTPLETAGMIKLIRSLRDQYGLTILLIEHDMNLIMEISERVAVMDYGQKIAEGTPEEVRHDPRVIEAYLGSLSDADLVQV
jgi:branched-chain amino acid transport system ATP-binding protein